MKRRKKKNCLGCRALACQSQSIFYCLLGFTIVHNENCIAGINGITNPVPGGLCPKPRTYEQFQIALAEVKKGDG